MRMMPMRKMEGALPRFLGGICGLTCDPSAEPSGEPELDEGHWCGQGPWGRIGWHRHTRSRVVTNPGHAGLVALHTNCARGDRLWKRCWKWSCTVRGSRPDSGITGLKREREHKIASELRIYKRRGRPCGEVRGGNQPGIPMPCGGTMHRLWRSPSRGQLDHNRQCV